MLALRALMRCGLSRGRLVISDANEGLKQAIFTLVGAAWQRCRVHFMRNALAQVPPDGGKRGSAPPSCRRINNKKGSVTNGTYLSR
jgi:transposase-like protein